MKWLVISNQAVSDMDSDTKSIARGSERMAESRATGIAKATHIAANGIWSGEIYGPYGWENSGVYVLEHGRILGGNNRHYSIGSYSVSGNTYQAEIVVHYYGPPRAIFGEKREQFEIEVTGTLGEGVIDGQIDRPDRPEFSLQYRMTKRMDVPVE